MTIAWRARLLAATLNSFFGDPSLFGIGVPISTAIFEDFYVGINVEVFKGVAYTVGYRNFSVNSQELPAGLQVGASYTAHEKFVDDDLKQPAREVNFFHAVTFDVGVFANALLAALNLK